jgi:multiple sugar transport system ATP-binding protein
MASVQLRSISKSFGAQQVIRDVSIDIDDGEFVTLVGPSGCGKSTLLRILAGLEDASDGDILIGERNVNDVAPKERDIAMVFQSYALYPHMSVEENMGFALKLEGRPKSEIAEKVRAAADILALGPLIDRLPKQLSGGQRQRVAMGRAIDRDPQVFLFDEPLSNLDAKLRVAMRAEIKSLHQRLRATMVYVTHDQVEAMTMADRIVVMRVGAVEQVGRPLELYDHPANAFVAAFIGSPSMNLLNGACRDGAFVTDGGVSLPLPANAPTHPKTYGIRPEHLALASAGVPATVHVVEPTGADTHVLVRLGTDEVTVLARDRVHVEPGQAVHLAPDLSRMHLFDIDGRVIKWALPERLK